MPEKKPIRNAFYYFMLDYKERCMRNGERFPNGLRDVQELAGPEWDSMPPDRRRPYELKAKQEKEAAKGDAKKVTCMHTPFNLLDKKKEEDELFKETLNSYLACKITSLLTKRTLLQEQTWYVIHVNYFCVSMDGTHIPAEIAIAEFSLEKGVIDVYHAIVDAVIPLGYRHDAMQRSETFHHIPVEHNSGAQPYELLNNITKFIKKERVRNEGQQDTYKYPPLYTMTDNVNQNYSMAAVKSFFNAIHDADCVVNEELQSILIYPIDKLFMELKDAASRLANTEPFINSSMAGGELEKDLFKWSPDIACKFHQEDDSVVYCSKSYVQRWVFTICDHCCPDLEIPLIPGKHLALNSDTNFQRRAQAVEQEKKAAPVRPFRMIDHSKLNQPKPRKVYSYDQTPLRRPQGAMNPVLLVDPPEPAPFDSSEDNFPSIPVGNRGRGRVPRGMGRGAYNPPSFADAMKNKK